MDSLVGKKQNAKGLLRTKLFCTVLYNFNMLLVTRLEQLHATHCKERSEITSNKNLPSKKEMSERLSVASFSNNCRPECKCKIKS